MLLTENSGLLDDTIGTPVVPAPLLTVNVVGDALMPPTATPPKSAVPLSSLMELALASVPPSFSAPLSVLPPHPAATSAPAKPSAANRSKDTRLPEQFMNLASIANQREHSPRRA